MKVEFGYYPKLIDFAISDIEVRTLPDLDRKMELVNSEGVARDWVYAPPQEVYQMGDFGRGIQIMPYASRMFGLPKTHVLSHSNANDEDHLTFLLWALSFFEGMRLTATECGFIDSTPLKPGILVDFRIAPSSFNQAIMIAETFWLDNRITPIRAKHFSAAVHALFLAQNPRNFQFESFNLLYMAVDTCFALAATQHRPPKNQSHSTRISWLCELLGIPIPKWANQITDKPAEIVALRNNMTHESLFMQEPLGFALHGVGTGINLIDEMKGLVCRLLMALLGATSCSYIRTKVNTGTTCPIKFQ